MNGEEKYNWAMKNILRKSYSLYELYHCEEGEDVEGGYREIKLGEPSSIVHIGDFEAFTLAGAMEKAVAHAMWSDSNTFAFADNVREDIEVRNGEFVEVKDENGEIVGWAFGISIMELEENEPLWNSEFILIEN